MSEMIERVARALHEKMCEQDVNGYLAAQLDAEGLARAAIEAMREPTEAMTASCGNGECAKWAPGAWANYIDTALSEGKP